MGRWEVGEVGKVGEVREGGVLHSTSNSSPCKR